MTSVALVTPSGPHGGRSRARSARLDAIRSYIANHSAATGSLVRGNFQIWTLSQAEKLSTMLAMQYPDPNAAAIGIWELLSNAIEHGNLEIDFNLKTELLRTGRFQDEIDRRSKDPILGARVATVEFRRLQRSLKLKVADQGSGFNFARYTEAAPSHDLPNGRGIFIAATVGFSRLRYLGNGNIVEATTLLPNPARADIQTGG